MSKKDWEQFPQEWRTSVISIFKLQGVDFEKTFLKDDCQEDKPEKESPWMSRKEAAIYANVCLDTIDNWRKNGLLKDYKLALGRPGKVLIDRKSLKRHLDSKIVNDPFKRNRETPMKGSRYRAR